jgi:hypothetical protein
MSVSPISLGIALVLTLVGAYLIGSLIHNLNAARAVGVFAVGVIAFLGTLSMAHRGSTGPYESGEVRVAVTCAFMMVYFAILGIFLFSINEVGTFGQGLVNNLTSLFGVVVGFYFASSAVVEYGRTRASGTHGATGTVATGGGVGPGVTADTSPTSQPDPNSSAATSGSAAGSGRPTGDADRVPRTPQGVG